MASRTCAQRRGTNREAARVAPADTGDRVDRGVRQWRLERPDLDSSGKEVVGRVVRLHDLAMQAIDKALTPYGLKYPAYGVLATIRVSGPPYRMSPGQLLQTLLYTSGGLSNLLARLEKGGFVRRLTDPQDGRGVIVELTRRGHALTQDAMTAHARAERALVAALTDEEQAQLAGLLRRVVVANEALARTLPSLLQEQAEQPA